VFLIYKNYLTNQSDKYIIDYMIKICNKEKIIIIYLNSNLSLDSAAIKIGCSTTTLRKWMKKYNIKAKPRFRYGSKKGAKFSILSDKKWLEEQLNTKSFRDIAKEIGTTEGNISDRVKRHGLRPQNWTHSSYTKTRLKNKYPNGRYGKNASNWKGGISSLYHLIRTNEKYKKWRILCMERDNYQCQECKRSGGNLEVDHIVQFAYIIKKYSIKNIKDALKCKELWNIDNGKTLCINCHKKTKSHSNKNF